MSYTIALHCGCVVYVSCHPATHLAHTRVIESVGTRCMTRRHERGSRVFLWELLPEREHTFASSRYANCAHNRDGGSAMADQDETEDEHRRIRSSNDRDQKAERDGKKNRHNEGYDEAADGTNPAPQIERVVDE
jgi:hypothetical protein